MSGSVIDVVVDLRQESTTFKQHFTLKIDSRDTFLIVPKGFAHGYYTLKDETLFYYAVDNFYQPEAESGLIYNDPELKIDWGLIGLPIISEKDKNQPSLNEAHVF